MKANEVAATLGISLSTLRKYALLLEANNYQFKRDSQNNRLYSPADIEILYNFIKIRKKNIKMTNKEILSELEYDTYLQMSLPLDVKKQDISETIASEIEVLKTNMNSSQQALKEVYTLLISIKEQIEKQEVEMKEMKESIVKIANKKGLLF